MPWSARRLLALALLAAFAGAATAQAVAAPRAKHAPAKAKKRKAAKKARAVKLTGGTAWVPPAIVNASRPPLTGTGGSPGNAPSGGGTSPGATPTTPGPTTTPTGPTDPPAQQALGVTVDERNGYTMVLSRTRLSSGSVVVQLINNGADAHNLRIVRTDPSGDPVDLPETPKQSQTTQTLTLGPGSYYLFCTLTTPVNHADAGMHATLRVDP